jgi:hypothetical protein
MTPAAARVLRHRPPGFHPPGLTISTQMTLESEELERRKEKNRVKKKLCILKRKKGDVKPPLF